MKISCPVQEVIPPAIESLQMDTALHMASSLTHLGIVQALVHHGANVWYRDPMDETTAVEVVVEQKRAPLTMYLVELMLSTPQSEEALPGWMEVASNCALDSVIHPHFTMQ